MNILVLGANGMAGHTIALYFIEKGHSVTTLTRKPLDIGINVNLSINAENSEELKNIIIEKEFDAVINCIGILNQNAEENKDTAIFLNSYLPHFLSNITKNSKTKIVHMSTDCVFSGSEGNYQENSIKDGYTFYDRTKALGELSNNKDLTFRNSIIGPDMNKDGIGLFNWFMQQSDSIDGFEKAIWTGVTTVTLARAMEAAIIQNVTGLYNLVNNEKINKFEMLIIFNEIFKNNEVIINSNNHVVIDKSLLNTRKDFEFEIPSYKEMFIEMHDWIVTHKDYYKHYFINNHN